jgi:hypothetical protein
MYDTETIKACIQEWLADATSVAEVARTYAVIWAETEKQLDYVMREMTKGSEHK